MTLIIAASTGTGKSTAARNSGGRVCDSDSDYFKYDRSGEHKVLRPEWPKNFINHPAQEVARGWYDAVLISAYGELLPEIFAQVPIMLVYPRLDMKDEFESRYRARGNSGDFLAMLLENYIPWIEDLMAIEDPHVTHHVLQPNQYLSEVLPGILVEP